MVFLSLTYVVSNKIEFRRKKNHLLTWKKEKKTDRLLLTSTIKTEIMAENL